MKPDFEFNDFINHIRRSDQDAWVTVHKREEQAESYVQIHCALMPIEQIPQILSNTTADLGLEHGLPGYIEYPATGEPPKYFRYGRDSGIEPLVFRRSFIGNQPEYLEVSEEFRHYFNLSRCEDNSNLVASGKSGEPIDVVRIIGDSEVRISLKYLKEFLSVKGMALSMSFYNEATYQGKLSQYGMNALNQTMNEEDMVYRILLTDEVDWKDHEAFYLRCVGKKIIRGDPNFDPLNPEGTREPCLSFIIGVDDNGKAIEYSSDPDGLADYYGKNEGAPNYMTRVFFRREVLDRYYDDDRYTVEAGVLHCNGFWYLRIDNDNVDDVNVSLGDLGDLPIDHQSHWKAYNVVPEGQMSKSAYGREVLGEFTKSEHPVFTFKAQFDKCQENWHDSLGWHLFIPLSEKDSHLYDGLRIPPGSNQRGLDMQVQALATILVDSINSKMLKAFLKENDDLRSIQLLANLCKRYGDSACDEYIDFLKQLQAARSSGSAHRKGKKYESAMAKLNPQNLKNDQLFTRLLIRGQKALQCFERIIPALIGAKREAGDQHTSSNE